jgi:hypothetical protein
MSLRHPRTSRAEAGEQKEEGNCQRDKLEGRPTNVCVPLLDKKRHRCFGHPHRNFGMSDRGRQDCAL